MLVVALQDRVDEVIAIAAKWELDATPIGRVTGDGLFRVRHGQTVVAEIPGQRLVEDCPTYTPDAVESVEARERRARTPSGDGPPPSQALRDLLGTPAIASKRWVFEQYDSTVQAGTVIGPGGDAAVLRIPGSRLGIAVSTDCNARYVLLDPREGARGAVAEAARNVACTGARPIGITNCLNFGNPERPEIYHQFREACQGMADACRALGTPVTGGNVSFYNESPRGAVAPTPVIGMVGVLDDAARAVSAHVSREGDAVLLLGATRGHLGGSSYWAWVLGATAGSPPPVDLEAERRLIDLLVALAAEGRLRSAHDVSDGGLAVAAAEAAIGGPYAERGFGLALDLRSMASGLTTAGLLFGEDHGRALLSVDPEHLPAIMAAAQHGRVPVARLGTVGAADGPFVIILPDTRIEVPVARLRQLYFGALAAWMDDTTVARAS
jgi:phosphoribosylformylglycinamidine synthase